MAEFRVVDMNHMYLLHPKNKSTCSDGTWHSPSLQLELKVSPSRITNIIGIITLCPHLMYLTDKIMLKYGSVIVVGITLLCWEDKISCPLDVQEFVLNMRKMG